MGGKIPVTVVTGFLGSGKTTLLNRLLNGDTSGSASLGPDTVVLVNELGDVSLDHERYIQLDGRVIVLESGCICCSVRGDLVTALRQLFMDALHRKIPPFRSVAIETTGIADPATLMYTLTYERFLADRYTYAGCITVMDAVHGPWHMREQPEALRQVVLADVFVISKTDLVDQTLCAAFGQTLEALNPGTPQYSVQALPRADELFRVAVDQQRGGPRKRTGRVWSHPDVDHPLMAHTGVGVLTIVWHETMTRSTFIRALSDLLSEGGLLRLKGKVYFEGESGAAVVHAIHEQLYPIEALSGDTQVPLESERCGVAEPAQGIAETVLVFIFRDRDSNDLLRHIKDLLPHGVRVLSPDGNFFQ